MSSSENHQVSAGLEAWYSRRNGQYLLASLRKTLEPILDTSFGYHILQLGDAPGQTLFDHSPINHRIYSADHPHDGVSLVSTSDELPLESDSIDTLIAHHSLEFGPNPHRVLREMQRVLAPQGHLLIVGFNPYSLIGLAAYCRRFARKPLWQHHHPVSRFRLTDWLHLLGCEVQSCHHLYSFPPLGQGRLYTLLSNCNAWSDRHNLPTGGLYVLHAIKQVSALNKPRMRLRERGGRLIGLAVAKPRAVPTPTPAIPGSSQVLNTTGDGAQ